MLPLPAGLDDSVAVIANYLTTYALRQGNFRQKADGKRLTI